MKIKVTQDHIDRGVRRGLLDCPIALAFGEQPDLNTRDFLCSHLPIEAVIFIGKFDAGKSVQPFEFEWELPNAPATSNPS